MSPVFDPHLFLATTALSEFWDKSQEILFLGSWCLRYEQRKELERLKHQVLPNPWDDRKRLDEACAYVDRSYERVLGHLAEYLNTVQQVSCSRRYWRILIGPWLIHYLHVAYDRYVCLFEAFKTNQDLHTIVLDSKSFQVPRNAMEARNLALDDPFNLQICSQQLQALGYGFPSRNFREGFMSSGVRNWRSGAKRLIRRALGFARNTLCQVLSGKGSIALCYMYCPFPHMLQVAWQTRFQAMPYDVEPEWSFALPPPAFDQRRNGLALLPSSDTFERVFMQSLPQNFPLIYLEGFQQARHNVLARIRHLPEVMVSAVGWWFTSEPFKFLAAEAAERGSRLVTVQHGSGYGTSRYHVCEQHEADVADSFMVWGWAEQGARSCRNLPNSKLSSLLIGHQAEKMSLKSKEILFVATGIPRYVFRLICEPAGSQWEDYFKLQIRFLTALPDHLSPQMRFRPFPDDLGRAVRERILERFPNIFWDPGWSFYRSIKHCRIVVVDHPGTSALEVLAANIPAVLFWDPQRWAMRREAEPYFDGLRKVGILWDSPETAAAKLAEIYHDPWAWWGSPEVQGVRKEFADRYALAREDWVECWANALAEELSLNQKEH